MMSSSSDMGRPLRKREGRRPVCSLLTEWSGQTVTIATCAQSCATRGGPSLKEIGFGVVRAARGLDNVLVLFDIDGMDREDMRVAVEGAGCRIEPCGPLRGIAATGGAAGLAG